MPGTHTRRNPSSWDRWSVCPGSLRAEEGAPSGGSSPYADEGTAAHEVFRRVNLARHSGFGSPTASAQAFLGQEIEVHDEGEEPRLITVSPEMVEHVDACADYVSRRITELRQHKGGTVPVLAQFELRVDPAPLIGYSESAGTADVVLLADHHVEVIDLKYGKGVVVEPGTPETPNGQCGLYLLGVLAKWPMRAGQVATATILQPRAYHPDGPFRSVTLEVGHVVDFVRTVKTAIAATEVEDPPRIASEKGCRWCAAKGGCRVYLDWSAGRAGLKSFAGPEVETWATRDPRDIDEGELIGILNNADLIRGALSAVEMFAHEALVKGFAPPGLLAAYKLVRGRSQRRWVNEVQDTTLSALTKIRWPDPTTGKTIGLKKKELVQEKLVSPTQVEALLKKYAKDGGVTDTHWAAFRRLVDKPAGKLELAHITDARPDAGPRSAAAMFGGEAPSAPAVELIPE